MLINQSVIADIKTIIMQSGKQAIIEHLQDFLLQINGFSLSAKQKNILADGVDICIDLAFYHRFLQCFVIIGMKENGLTHQDVEQLKRHLNYYDQSERIPCKNATIGILLCTSKNDPIAQFILPDGQEQTNAIDYQMYLPTAKQLQEEVRKAKAYFEEKVEEL